MKKWLITSLVVIALLFSGCALLIDKLLLNEDEVLELNWNINLPKADQVTEFTSFRSQF